VIENLALIYLELSHETGKFMFEKSRKMTVPTNYNVRERHRTIAPERTRKIDLSITKHGFGAAHRKR
jgi:hypothetical protein